MSSPAAPRPHDPATATGHGAASATEPAATPSADPVASGAAAAPSRSPWWSLRRITTTGAYVPEVDGVRFFAIVPVILFHLGTDIQRQLEGLTHASTLDAVLRWIVERSSFGVRLFFVISGYVLGARFVKSFVKRAGPLHLKDYFIRRLTRLEPAYVLSLLVLYAAQVFVRGVDAGELFDNLIASIFYVHGFVFGSWSEVNPVAWSLEVEVQFYLLAPFASRALLAPRSATVRRGLIAAACIPSILLETYGMEALQDVHLAKSILPAAHYFLAGLLLADIFAEPPRLRSRMAADALFFVGIAAIYLLADHASFAAHAAYVVALGAMLYAAIRGRYVAAFMRIPSIAVIGGMCYSLYLLHYATIHLVVGRLGGLSTGAYATTYLVVGAVVVPIVLIVGTAFYMVVERPTMVPNWPSKLAAYVRSLASGRLATSGAGGVVSGGSDGAR